ncbi:MAG: PD-(D/E)XK nuclease family protein, partial [Pseudobutyrivibrio sp.]|nr:PD-(D/E)XK nuclease family protein [Pseudobutyrivibrio sp.]
TSTLSADELGLISQNRLESFLHTSLADRMHLAALRGELYKEQPFVLSCPVRELFADAESEDETNTVLVQGIIDVFFKEDDGIVLMDYKTDRVDEVGELVLRYEKQLALYGKALSRAYKLPVKEILIYSFYFNEVIPCTIS